MDDIAPEPIDEELAQLLIDWINADTWDESQTILKANAQRLLSDDTFKTLISLIFLNTPEDENEVDGDDKVEILQKHLAILNLARSESIESAYAKLLQPSPLTLALKALPDELRAAIQAMIAVNSSDELLEQVNQYPILLTPEATAAIDRLLDELRQAEQLNAVEHIDQRYHTLKNVIEAVHDPLNAALNALLQANSPGKLQQVIAKHPMLLEDETLNALAGIIPRIEQDGDTVAAQRLRFRLDEVRRIRVQRDIAARNINSHALERDTIEGEQVRLDADRNSIAVWSNDGSITQTNIENYKASLPAKQWQAPKRQALRKTFVGREKELKELRDYLASGEDVAISGTTTTTMLQGMGGIGKTFLAVKLSMDLQSYFPAGVIRIDLGPLVTNEERAQVQLRKLAGFAFGGIQPQILGLLEPEQVAAWLQEMAPGRLLIIFDDAWHQEPLLFLERAIPADAVCIVTTRDANIAQALGGKKISLERLTDEDGLALLEDRLGCQGDSAYRTDLKKLVVLLGGHALALDIVAARIKRPGRIQAVLKNLQKGVGQERLDGLKLRSGESRETNLEKSLALSYDQMTSEEQSRFRALGVFAPETPITVEAAAAIWNLDDPDIAQKVLTELTDLALLNEFEDAMGITYRQHSLLHTYGYALLDKMGELNSASWGHAEYYRVMALRAETATPKDYPLLDQHIQNLQAALQWTDKHEPELFARLVEVLFQFLQLRGQSELLEIYLPKALSAASATGNELQKANLLQSLGDLERRLGNIDEARGQYDAALPLYRSERARLGEANLYMAFGDMFLAQKDWTQARIYYERTLPLYIIERDPLGQANTLIDLGRARFELGEHEQGMQDVQKAAALFHSVQAEEWVHRAEQYLDAMRRKMQQPGTDAENVLESEGALLEAFINVDSPQSMLQLVEQHPRLLTGAWFSMIGELIGAQTDEGAQNHLSERLATLKQIKQGVEEQASLRSGVIQALDEFARANWTKRRQLLDEQADILLSEEIESVFDMLAAEGADIDAIQVLEQLRALLRRCRNWGIEAVWYFELQMRLGDSVDIPDEYESDVMRIATMLSRQREDSTEIEQAVAAMHALLNRLTAETPRLFEAALLRDLAIAMEALPSGHVARKLDQIEAYYREAIPLYAAANRSISVAYTQRSLGDLLSGQGRYEEALEPLRLASQGLQEYEQNRDDAIWALSAYANILDKLGRLEEALATYAEALRLKPDTPPLLRNRVETLIHARRLEEAEVDLARAAELDGNENSPYLWYRRAQLAIARGNALLAGQMIVEVAKREASFDMELVQAQSAWLKGDVITAQEALRKVFEQANPGDRAAMRREMQLLFDEHPELAAINKDLIQNKEYLEAVLNLARQLSDQQFLYNILFELGTIYVAQGRWYDGLKLLEENLTILRKSDALKARSDTIYQIARTQHLMGNLDKARIHYRDALRLYEHIGEQQGIAACKTGLGRLMIQIGFIPDARSELERAYQIYCELGDNQRSHEVEEVMQLIDRIEEK